MKAISVAIALLLGSFVIVQDSTAQDSTDEKFLERVKAALAKHVQADIAVTHNGEKLNVARSDIRLEWLAGKKFKIWVRVNFLPIMPGARDKIIAELNHNEDIILKVSDVIHQGVRNAMAARLGIPAEFVVVPAPILKAQLDEKLGPAVATFVDSKITDEAQLAAAMREFAIAYSAIGDADSPTQLVFEAGKMDSVHSKDHGYFTNQFALSNWGMRATFRKQVSETWEVSTYVQATDDAGLWENADLNAANPNVAFLSTLLARNSKNLFDINGFNSYEVGVVNTVGQHSYILSVGIRPVLDRGVDARYVLARYDGSILGMRVDAQGSLESFEDPIYGSTLVKRVEAGISKEFYGFTASTKFYQRFDTIIRKDGQIIQAALGRELFGNDDFSVSAGGRVFTSRLTGVDDNGNPYARNKGVEGGLALKFGRPTRPNPADVLSRRDQALNAERLKAQKKAQENK